MNKPPVIIFDWNRTLYDPETQALDSQALAVIQSLHEYGCSLYLISTDGKERRVEVSQFLSTEIFKKIFIVSEKSLDQFRAVKHLHPESEIWVVGDRIQKEIFLGKSAGMKTIWFQSGKFSKELPRSNKEEPDFKINTLGDLINLVPVK